MRKTAFRTPLASLLALLALCVFVRPSSAEENPPAPAESGPEDEASRSSEDSVNAPSKTETPVKDGPVAQANVEDHPAATTVGPQPAATPRTPLDLPSGGAKTGVSSQAISLPQGAGKIGGLGESFSTNPSTGVGTYAIPIAMPAARGAAQPSLALSYSSASGYGVAGVGWDLAVPFIARQTDRGIPGYQDPAPGGGWTPQQDRFIFNGGQELVPICLVGQGGSCTGMLAGESMPSWAAGWQYFRPRVEGGFMRFFWSPDHQTWRVQSKMGTTLELGVPQAWQGQASQNAIEADPANPSHIFRWNLALQYDVEVDAQARPVNLVVYQYQTGGGLAYLSDIYDTPPAAGTATAGVSTFAHHTHVNYENRTDPVSSFRRGYRTDQLLRVVGVDVTSMPFNPGQAATPQLVRRYHLAYDTTYHASALHSVTVEGRCTNPISESQGLLPTTTPCPMLPPTVLGYQHVTGYSIDGQSPIAADLPGYEPFDERVWHIASSPNYSLDGKNADLFDINADGLPDVLVTLPGFFGGNHGVFFNVGKTGATFDGNYSDKLAFYANEISVTGVPNETSTDITLSNANVTPHDLDGDGIIDLLHMPLVKTYSVYTPKGQSVTGPWTWAGRAITTAAAQDPHVDFTNHNADIKVMDVNGDGLVDIVYSAGTEMQTFLALGRYEGGDGQFGHMVYSGSSAAPTISNDPITSCIPWDATPVTLSDPDVTIADMNGDGLPDIVRVRRGLIEYWPGRGDGTWGTGQASDCAAGTFGQGLQIETSSAPWYSQLEALPFLEDVNGDGLADLVVVRFDGVDIWLNVDGVGWTANPHTINGTPPISMITNHVRIADMNGSGTRDILWGDAGDYKYIDLLGGVVPSVLTSVDNGLGRTTDIAYSSSTALMLADAQNPAPNAAWTSTTPMPVNVVTSITTHDNLPALGNPEGVYVTQYEYRNPLYDGRQREFRGFQIAGTRQVGDANSPTSITRAKYLLGECQEETPNSGTCSAAYRWQDNPREALKGIPVLAETFDESGSDPTAPGYNFLDATGVYASTTHTTVRLRHLYWGLDGREVRVAFTSKSDAYLYDLGVTPAAGTAVPQQDVELELTPGVLSADPEPLTNVTPRSTQGMAHTQSASVVDVFGNAQQSIAYGCVAGCATADETITSWTVPGLPPGDGSGWLWRTVETYTTGSSNPAKLHDTFLGYDSLGHLVTTTAVLSGTLPLDRFHEDPTKLVAGPPPGASADGVVTLGSTQWDSFGNAQYQSGANGRCVALGYDAAYAQLVVTDTTYAGAASGNGCGALPSTTRGATPLTTVASYDRGLAEVVSMIGLHGEVSQVGYDGFGRITSVTKPDPNVVGMLSASPSTTVEYLLGSRYSRVHTQTQDGASGTDPSVPSYRDTWTYVDGLGRTIITISQADPSAGDAAAWIASGAARYDAKGAVMHAYLPWFYGGAPDSVAVTGASTLPSSTSYKRARYDAFGHTVQAFNLDGSIAAQAVFHALSVDAYDAENLAPGPHNGAFSTQVHDGHGRAVRGIERIHVQGTLEQHATSTTYLASGEVTTITRQRLGFSDAPVVRWMAYDSLGRRVLNVDPNTTSGPMPAQGADPSTFHAWRYAYDDAGDLVGTSDARGCGVNYYYDTAGRSLAEDYSPCLSTHADYSEPDFSTGYGIETLHLYDTPDPDTAALGAASPGLTIASNLLLGRLVSVADRGAKVLFQYDGRGRTTGIGKRIARPGPANDDPTLRYAPRWYVSTVSFDEADRPVLTSTGAVVPELMGASNASTVSSQYSNRGTVTSVSGSYGALVTGVVRDANGLVTQTSYGDAAGTTTTSSFDARLRPLLVQTVRASAPIWSAPPAPYTPPSTSPSTLQLILEDTHYAYDQVDNPIQIQDLRDPTEWPVGAKPVSRTMQYDDLYRITRVDAQYPGGPDGWVSPFAAEDSGPVDSRLATPSPHVSFPQRIQYQSFAYDWLGNTTATDDDANGFYDRSLGTITNGTASHGPYQLQAAANAAGTPSSGALTAAYDAAGNLTSLAVQRNGTCLPAGASCSQRFAYDWDEVGRLVRARRWDQASAGAATDPVPTATAAADLAYAYDSSNQRVLKTATDAADNQRHTVFVFGSLDLRRAEWLPDPSDLTTGDYDDSAATEVPYLAAHGDRLARVAYDTSDPSIGGATTHVLLEMADHLGSTTAVIDKATGELAERATYQAYGATDGDYRPQRWDAFREDYRFTGKEEDAEVGLTYFGQRYYAPLLGRWMSPDPLAVHALGADLNLYAYVHGSVFRAVDPLGLQDGVPYEPPGVARDAKGNESEIATTNINIPRAVPGPVVPVPPPPAPTDGGGNKFNPYNSAGHFQISLFGSEKLPPPPIDPATEQAVGKVVFSLVPGVNTLATCADPHASTGDKVFAGVTDLVAVFGGELFKAIGAAAEVATAGRAVKVGAGGAIARAAAAGGGGGGRLIALDSSSFLNLAALQKSGLVTSADKMIVSTNVATELARHGVAAADLAKAGVEVASHSPVGASVAATRVADVLRGLGGRGAASAAADALNLVEAAGLGADTFITVDRQVLRGFGGTSIIPGTGGISLKVQGF